MSSSASQTRPRPDMQDVRVDTIPAVPGRGDRQLLVALSQVGLGVIEPCPPLQAPPDC